MLRRTYEADWERKKNYLIRSLFHDVPDLSIIRESDELSASPPHTAERVIQEDAEPLPDLIIERVPKRRNDDESQLYYCGLRKRMRKYYRTLFNIERGGSSSPDFEDFKQRHTTFNQSGSDDDEFEYKMNRAFVENVEANNTELNRSNVSDNRNETYHLEEIQSVAAHIDEPKSSEDNTDNDLISAATKTIVKDKNSGSVEKNKSASSDMTIGENSKENIDPERNMYDTQTDSESTSQESLILPAGPPQRRQNSLLETTEKSKQSNGTNKSSLSESSEENSLSSLIESEDVEKENPENSNEISRTVEKAISEIENDESMMEETVNDVNKNQNEDPLERNAEEKENSEKSINNEITKEQENSQESNNSTDKDNSKNKDTLNGRQDNDKMMIDEVEIMRSHNNSPSTQSLVATSNSSSPPNVHLERRGEITHSLVSDRESVELDIATRVVDVNQTSPEHFHPLLRCSTPISTHLENRDEFFDRNNSRVQHSISGRTHDIIQTTSINRECDIADNISQAAVEITDKREERATAELIPSAQNLASTRKETNVPETFKVKEFREKEVQTDDMIMENEKNIVDVGVQVQEKEKEIASVQVQTDEDEVSGFFGRQRIFRKGSNYFFFL